MQDLIAAILFLIIIVVIIAAIIFVPWGVLWCINAIFGTSLVISLKSWFAIWMLFIFFNAN